MNRLKGINLINSQVLWYSFRRLCGKLIMFGLFISVSALFGAQFKYKLKTVCGQSCYEAVI